jgi:hypothetical protein
MEFSQSATLSIWRAIASPVQMAVRKAARWLFRPLALDRTSAPSQTSQHPLLPFTTCDAAPVPKAARAEAKQAAASNWNEISEVVEECEEGMDPRAEADTTKGGKLGDGKGREFTCQPLQAAYRRWAAGL